MEYPFWVNDFDRIKDHKKHYPNVGKIFEHPVSFWYSRSLSKLSSRVNRLFLRAEPALPIIVIYNLPDRDVGQHSAGGASKIEDYILFVNEISLGIGDRQPILIFEPDALPHCIEMTEDKRKERLLTMSTALSVITDTCNAKVYVDIGHSNWLDAEIAGQLINAVSNKKIRGFSVNVSNFRSTEESTKWALEVGEYTPYKNFVIDTSRNGTGPYGTEWCNPMGRALGTPATTDTAHKLCDAYLWIKIPGESDGKCNGGPHAGKFWPYYANDLIENTAWIK